MRREISLSIDTKEPRKSEREPEGKRERERDIFISTLPLAHSDRNAE